MIKPFSVIIVLWCCGCNLFTRKITSPFAPLVAKAMAVRERIRLVLANGLWAETNSQLVINNAMLVFIIDYVVYDIKSLYYQSLAVVRVILFLVQITK